MDQHAPRRYLSIERDAPAGFEYSPEPSRRDLRSAMVALWTRDPAAVEARLGAMLEKIRGVLLCPGQACKRTQLGPSFWRVEVSEAAIPVLVEFAETHLIFQASSIELRNTLQRRELELERERMDRAQLADKLDKETQGLREQLITRTAWTAEAMTALVEFNADGLADVQTAALPLRIVEFLTTEPLSLAGAGLWLAVDGRWELQARCGDPGQAELPAPGSTTGVQQLDVSCMAAVFEVLQAGSMRECLLVVRRPRGLDRADASFLLLFVLQIASTYRARAMTEALSQAIAHKDALIAELSTPIIQVWHDMVCLPVIGSVDSRRAMQIATELLGAVSERSIRHVIVDFTGISTMDTETMHRFTSLARAIGLLGASCTLTGISPAVAQSLVTLSVELGSIDTRPSVQAALRRRLAGRSASRDS